MKMDLITRWGYFKEVETIVVERGATDEGVTIIRFGITSKQGEGIYTWWFKSRSDEIEVLLNAIGNTLSYLGDEEGMLEITINTINNIVTWESESNAERITLGEILDELLDELEEKQETVAERRVKGVKDWI